MIYQEETAINKQNFALFEVLGDPYCDSNVNNRTETYAANLIFIW